MRFLVLLTVCFSLSSIYCGSQKKGGGEGSAGTSGGTAGGSSNSGNTSNSQGGSGGEVIRKTSSRSATYFHQDSYSGVDILWVVDNSGSMQPRQSDLIESAPQFINYFVTKKKALGFLDINMAVVTTDDTNENNYDGVSPCLQKKALAPFGFVPGLNGKSWFSLSDPSFLEDFKKRIKVGVCGSPFEKGLAG